MDFAKALIKSELSRVQGSLNKSPNFSHGAFIRFFAFSPYVQFDSQDKPYINVGTESSKVFIEEILPSSFSS